MCRTHLHGRNSCRLPAAWSYAPFLSLCGPPGRRSRASPAASCRLPELPKHHPVRRHPCRLPGEICAYAPAARPGHRGRLMRGRVTMIVRCARESPWSFDARPGHPGRPCPNGPPWSLECKWDRLTCPLAGGPDRPDLFSAAGKDAGGASWPAGPGSPQDAGGFALSCGPEGRTKIVKGL